MGSGSFLKTACAKRYALAQIGRSGWRGWSRASCSRCRWVVNPIQVTGGKSVLVRLTGFRRGTLCLWTFYELEPRRAIVARLATEPATLMNCVFGDR